MSEILTPVILVVAIGFAFALILTVASRIFFVKVDETESKLREALPGANCGGCGFAGCDDYAAALAKDPSIGTNLCPVGGADVAKALAEILGVTVDLAEPNVAVVKCNGTCDKSKKLMQYDGITSCKALKELCGTDNVCQYGCLGCGDCVKVCEFGAITVCNGVAVVNHDKCTGCGACQKACPAGVIELLPASAGETVLCNSNDNGAKTRKGCTAGCIACQKCVKACKFDAIVIENNLAKIDPAKCKKCGICARECPVGCIKNIKGKRKVAKPTAQVNPEN